MSFFRAPDIPLFPSYPQGLVHPDSITLLKVRSGIHRPPPHFQHSSTTPCISAVWSILLPVQILFSFPKVEGAGHDSGPTQLHD